MSPATVLIVGLVTLGLALALSDGRGPDARTDEPRDHAGPKGGQS